MRGVGIKPDSRSSTLVLGSAVVHKHTSCSVRVKDVYSAMYQNSKYIVKTRNWDETRWVTNTETLEQQKSNNWTSLGPTKDRASSSDQLNWKILGRSHHLFRGPTRRRVIKEDSKDRINNQACSLSHNIHAVSGSFITNKYFLKLIRKIISANIFLLNLYTKSP